MSIKKQAYEILLQAIRNKIAAIENDLMAIKESISNETKSTAGDKYETARAMLHIEQENVMKQLANAQNQKHELTAIDISLVSTIARHGSLVTTNYGIFFIATAMGKIVVDATSIVTLSKISPLGKVLMGKKENDIVLFDNRKYEIKKVE